ncbi:hypothetical protein EDD11_002049 [Mortierella claussenii]|nr:hypothetical protein EDD11_002049 [Mortierella claussenii]
MSTDPPTQKRPRHPRVYTGRAWGSFECTRSNNKQHTIRFTKQGNKGPVGYVFGRRPDCDVVLPASNLTSLRQFLVYKEVEFGTECVHLTDLSANGTYVNAVCLGTGKTARLEDGDKITYVEARKGKQRVFSKEYIFCKGEPEGDLTFDSQFEIGEQLGSGNFASVFKAIEKRSGVTFAVKRVKKSSNFNVKMAMSLEREIGTLMSIDHPNLLRIYKVFSEERDHFVVTELARGGELFDRVKKKGRFTESESRFVFRQLLEGVKYLHDRGIVHRDLKLENILLMDEDNLAVKISDFGLANITGEHKFLSTVCGTPSYVAPEVIRHQSYGKAVDMWSLGVVLYIMLCGFPPFSDELAPPSLRIQVLESRYTFPSPYWDDISDEAVNMVQDLLLLNPDQRLDVNVALSNVWMHLEDNMGTFPEMGRKNDQPKVEKMVHRIRTEYAYKVREHHRSGSGSRSRTQSEQSIRSLQVLQQQQPSLDSQRSHSMGSIEGSGIIQKQEALSLLNIASPSPTEGEDDINSSTDTISFFDDGEDRNETSQVGQQQSLDQGYGGQDRPKLASRSTSSIDTLVAPEMTPTELNPMNLRAQKRRKM